MTIKSKPYYWLVCDHEGCDGRSPSLGWEVDAWSDEEGALSGADGDDWTVTDAGEHYCPNHWQDALDPAERDAAMALIAGPS